jgi:excisionase family DNA binding protein
LRIFGKGPIPKLLTTAEVANELGISDERVRTLICSGRLKAKRFGQRVLMIEERALDAVRERRTARPIEAKYSGEPDYSKTNSDLKRKIVETLEKQRAGDGINFSEAGRICDVSREYVRQIARQAYQVKVRPT